MTADRRRFYSDLLERVVWTALQAFLAAVVVDNMGAGLDDGDLFKTAGIAALISAAKCLLATQIGAPNTAATLPEEDDTPRGDPGYGEVTLLIIGGLVVLVILLVAGRL